MIKLSKDLSPEEFLNAVDSLLSTSISDKNADFYQAVFATSKDTIISQRYVVIRQWQLKRRSLIFHTDYRSQKIKHLQHNKHCSFAFYSKAHHLQLRFNGVAHVHYQDRLAKCLFDEASASQRALYESKFAPSSPIHHPSDLKKGDDAYKNFAVCVCNFNTLELLYLHRLAHVRILYTWDKDGNKDVCYLTP